MVSGGINIKHDCLHQDDVLIEPSSLHAMNDSSTLAPKRYRITLYSIILIGLSISALFFYGLFKPSDVVLNRLLSHVISITPIMTEHNNMIVDTFIQTFGDFLSVMMTFMILSIVIHSIGFPMDEAKHLFQWIIIPFILFECMQIFGIGNFYIRDLIAYALGYQLSFYILNHIEKTRFNSLFDCIIKYIARKRKGKTHG